MDKESFIKYLDEQLDKANISETKLAKGVGISQKSINRYHQGETFPAPDIQQRIMEYFEALRQGAIKPGQKVFKMVDEDGSSYYVPEEQLGGDYDPLEHVEMVGEEEFAKCSVKVQSHVVRHLTLYCLLSKTDLEFLDRVHRLKERRQWSLISQMESIPIRLDMLLLGADDFNSYGDAGENPFFMAELILSRIRDVNTYESLADGKKAERGKDLEGEKKRLLYQYHESSREYFLVSCGRKVPEELFQIVEKTFRYTREDWYALFLLYRIKIQDERDFDNGEWLKLKPGHSVKAQEFATWKYLEALEANE